MPGSKERHWHNLRGLSDCNVFCRIENGEMDFAPIWLETSSEEGKQQSNKNKVATASILTRISTNMCKVLRDSSTCVRWNVIKIRYDDKI